MGNVQNCVVVILKGAVCSSCLSLSHCWVVAHRTYCDIPIHLQCLTVWGSGWRNELSIIPQLPIPALYLFWNIHRWWICPVLAVRNLQRSNCHIHINTTVWLWDGLSACLTYLTMFVHFNVVIKVSATASVVQWSELLATDPEARVRFPALP
jgi:hypothetical protein